VVYARPDLLWYRPVRPWCFWSASAAGLRNITSRRDFALLLPRAKMEPLLRAPYEDYARCRRNRVPWHHTIEQWVHRAWAEHGASPSNAAWDDPALPAMIMRQSHPARPRHDDLCQGRRLPGLKFPERQPWEPDFDTSERLCRIATYNNRHNRPAGAAELENLT
jgi:hypothetical protein